jgi:hypothetical protein
VCNTRRQLCNTRRQLCNTRRQLCNTRRQLCNTRRQLYNTRRQLCNTRRQFVRNVSTYPADEYRMFHWYISTKLHGVTYQTERHSNHSENSNLTIFRTTDIRKTGIRVLFVRETELICAFVRKHVGLDMSIETSARLSFLNKRTVLATHKINKDTEKSWVGRGAGRQRRRPIFLWMSPAVSCHCVPHPAPAPAPATYSQNQTPQTLFYVFLCVLPPCTLINVPFHVKRQALFSN